MDLEAEFQRITQEARQEMQARERRREEEEEREAPEAELPPTPIPERLREAAPEAPAFELDAASMLEAKRIVEETAGKTAALSLPAKLGLAAGGLFAFVLLWKWVLFPLVQALISVALLALILVGIWKVVTWGKDEADEEDPGA